MRTSVDPLVVSPPVADAPPPLTHRNCRPGVVHGPARFVPAGTVFECPCGKTWRVTYHRLGCGWERIAP